MYPTEFKLTPIYVFLVTDHIYGGCKLNEHYSNYINIYCQDTCKGPTLFCFSFGGGSCVCDEGYVRKDDYDGKCIKKNECPNLCKF